jgi:preprotein translocase subunit SecD
MRGVARLCVAVAAGLLAGCSGTSSTPPPASADGHPAHTFAARPVLSEQDISVGGCAVSTPPAETSQPTSACSYDGQRRYDLGPALLTGRDIASVKVAPLSTYFEVDVSLVQSARQTWSQATATAAAKQSPQNQIAMVVDGVVVDSPEVNASIDWGALGLFQPTRAKADQLVDKLNASRAP